MCGLAHQDSPRVSQTQHVIQSVSKAFLVLNCDSFLESDVQNRWDILDFLTGKSVFRLELSSHVLACVMPSSLRKQHLEDLIPFLMKAC